MKPSSLAVIAGTVGALALLAPGCGGDEPVPVSTTTAAVRRAATTLTSALTVDNRISKSVALRVTEVNNFDWAAPRPDHPSPEGFQNLPLSSGQSATRTLGVSHAGQMQGKKAFRIRFAIGAVPETPVSMRLEFKMLHDGQANVVVYGWGSSDTGTRDCSMVTHDFPEQKVRLRAWCDGGTARPAGVPQRNPGSGTLVIEPMP